MKLELISAFELFCVIWILIAAYNEGVLWMKLALLGISGVLLYLFFSSLVTTIQIIFYKEQLELLEEKAKIQRKLQ